MQSVQPALNGRGSRGHERQPFYGAANQTYNWTSNTYPVDDYSHNSRNMEEALSFQMAQQMSFSSPAIDAFRGGSGVYDGHGSRYDAHGQAVQGEPSKASRSQRSSNVGPHFEQGHYGRIPYPSLQSSENMGSGIQHRIVPHPIVYHQERNQGPIYNGNISGGVKNFNISNDNVLQYMKDYAATGAMHDSDERFPPPRCHAGTRGAVLYRVLDWYGYHKRPGKPIMWIYAPAGYGKTAVAGTVSEKLEAKAAELGFSLIGATFFFWRTSEERNSPARFIITLTYQLFVSIPELVPYIERAVKGDPMIFSKALEVQLMKLIIGPFKALGDTSHMPNRLIIVDGLDECINSDQESRVQKWYAEDQERVQARVLDLIHTLASQSLPLSFLILSRPEPWIKQHIESPKFEDLVEPIDLYEVGDNMEDVEKFVREELTRIGVDDEDLAEELVDRAGGHMLYASTVIRHIDDPNYDPRTRLKNLLHGSSSSNHDLTHSTPFSSLHELYRQILRSCHEGNSRTMVEVLGELLVSDRYGLNFSSNISLDEAVRILDGLSQRETCSGMRAIRGLHSMLNTSYSGDWFIHSSFPEFLRNPDLSMEFAVDGQEKVIQRFLSGCLDCLSTIMLGSTEALDELHVQYALFNWPWVWHYWIPTDFGPTVKADWSEMSRKLLTVDLRACFVRAFSLPDDDKRPFNVNYPPYLGIPDSSNIIFRDGAEAIYDSEPLVQQAVLHVAHSLTAAICHILKTAHLGSGRWSETFVGAVVYYLRDRVGEAENWPDDWRCDTVVQSLKTLRRESNVDFVRFKEGVYEKCKHWPGKYCDYINMVFDYTCIDS
ncbi:hypothetical protein MD484_g4651, partial [Candolleomyces efflorescens]